MKAPDLSRQAPRSPRVRLGGYVILPRMIDKARATQAGTLGEYKFGCPLDQRCLKFAGIDAEAFKQFVATAKGDGEILEWIRSNSKTSPDEGAIATWSAVEERRSPSDPDSRAYFNEVHSAMAPKRNDLMTWFDLLDMDDYVSFGGQA